MPLPEGRRPEFATGRTIRTLPGAEARRGPIPREDESTAPVRSGRVHRANPIVEHHRQDWRQRGRVSADLVEVGAPDPRLVLHHAEAPTEAERPPPPGTRASASRSCRAPSRSSFAGLVGHRREIERSVVAPYSSEKEIQRGKWRGPSAHGISRPLRETLVAAGRRGTGSYTTIRRRCPDARAPTSGLASRGRAFILPHRSSRMPGPGGNCGHLRSDRRATSRAGGLQP